MITSPALSTKSEADQPPAASASPRLWGLTARHLHDAYWHARGVQCIRRGRRQPLQRAAELFLLVDPDQLVLFDVATLSERLTWHNAVVTRLRLTEETRVSYSEHVVTDADGWVERIERRYRPTLRGVSWVVLTPSRHVAKIWMSAPTRRDGWDRARRSVAWSRVDHSKQAGPIFTAGDPVDEQRLLDYLVEHWSDPDRAIAGIVEHESGVWGIPSESSDAGSVRIGPLWLGTQANVDDRACVVGPAWIADDPSPHPAQVSEVRIRDIIDVELVDRPKVDDSGDTRVGYSMLKRATDLLFSAIAVLFLSPVLGLIAAAILLEDGMPVLYGHRRQGRGGIPFDCWKFRTMHRNAEQMVKDLEAYNICDGPQVYIVDDPRVTRMGKLLRNTHLDELPQLFNVLRGQMSLVGPRPSPDDENQFCPAWRDVRLSVRPGITGLWQLNRTREPGEDFQEWIKYDIEYVKRASYLLDLGILFKTALIMFFGRSDRASDETG